METIKKEHIENVKSGSSTSSDTVSGTGSGTSSLDSTFDSVIATRMSWFLAEADEGQLNGGAPNGKAALCVLHSMELIESDVTDKYVTRFVKFRVNNQIIDAKLILSADERSLIDGAMHVFKKEREQSKSTTTGKHMLVQYAESSDKLYHEMITQNQVTWPTDNLEYQPLVKLGAKGLVNVLHVHEDRSYLEKVMVDLKAKCFDFTFNEHLTGREEMNKDTWLLVQYSPKPEFIIYAIIPYTETIWHEQNLYKDVIAYIKIEEKTILQAIILSYSQQKSDLETKLNNMKQYCMRLDLPMPNEIDRDSSPTVSLFQRGSLFDRAEARDANGEYREMRQETEILSEGMQREALMIIDAFEIVENIRVGLELRRKNLNNIENPA